MTEQDFKLIETDARVCMTYLWSAAKELKLLGRTKEAVILAENIDILSELIILRGERNEQENIPQASSGICLSLINDSNSANSSSPSDG